MRRAATALALLAVCADNMAGQARVRVGDVGPGSAGRLLRAALAQPYRFVGPDTAPERVERGRRETGSIVAVGRTVYVDGTLSGDLIVVNGSAYIGGGGEVTGKAIAIGGGIYPSALAHVGGETRSFYFDSFRLSPTADGFRLDYESLVPPPEPPLLLPDVYGLRPPTYDRVNGLSLPFGPAFSFASYRGVANLLATYRSDLGRVDPSLDVAMEFNRRTRVHAFAARGSFSNDEWIWPNLVNSLSVLAFGNDTRNFYRADRVEATLHRKWEWEQGHIEPFVGGRHESASGVGPVTGGTSGPWSAFGRSDSTAMLRPNPVVPDGTITSVLGGAALEWQAEDLTLAITVRGEHGVDVSLENPLPPPATAPSSFTQLTTDIALGFGTFGDQSYAMDVHWVHTLGDTPPLQRFVYFGGSGTAPFLETLSQGGDRLLLVDQRYSIPIPSITVGFMGMPTLQLRHRIGSAGLGKLPAFEHLLGVGVSLTVIRGEIQVDAANQRARATVGFTFAR